MSSLAVIIWLTVGLVVVGVLSIVLPIGDRMATGRTIFRLIGAMVVVTAVFMAFTQAQDREATRARAHDAEQIQKNERTSEQIIEAFRNTEYETCRIQNDDRLYRRGEKRRELDGVQNELTAVQQSPIVVASDIPGYDEAADPAVRAIVDSFLANTQAQRVTMIQALEAEVRRLTSNLDRYVADFPLLECGDDPVPQEQIPPPPSALQPVTPSSVVFTTTTTSTTTVPLAEILTQSNTPSGGGPASRTTVASTFNPSGNPNAGPGNNNGNGNGGNNG